MPMPAEQDEIVIWRGPVPVYEQVAGFLRRRIDVGQLRPHDRLPSESEIMALHGVGRQTARKAVAQLRAENIVYTIAHRGTFVAE